MIFAADDMRNRHQMVIDHDRKVIGGHSVGPHDNEIAHGFAFKPHRPPDQVMKFNRRPGNLETIGRLPAGRSQRFAFFFAEISAFPQIARHAPGENQRPALLFQLFFRAIAGIRQVRVHQFFQMRRIEIQPFTLPVGAIGAADVRSFVPVKPQPFQVLQKTGLVGRIAAGFIRIFNPQNETTALAPGEHPVEQCGARIAHMQISGGRRRKTDSGLMLHPRSLPCRRPSPKRRFPRRGPQSPSPRWSWL